MCYTCHMYTVQWTAAAVIKMTTVIIWIVSAVTWINVSIMCITASNKTAVEELASCTLKSSAFSFKFSAFQIFCLVSSTWLQ